jgi:hypothetical protein
MNKTRTCGFLALALVAPVAVMAQGVALDYTATITGGSGIFASDTGTIGGIYNFNYSNADPGSSSGTVGSALGWASISTGPYVFSSTAFSTSSGNNVSYSDGSPGSLSDVTAVLASPGGVLTFTADNQQVSASESTFSTLVISSAGTPWNSAGLPTLGPGDVAAGEIQVDINGVQSELDYTVTSLKIAPTAAPEISVAPLGCAVTLLFGGLAVLRGRRSSELG